MQSEKEKIRKQIDTVAETEQRLDRLMAEREHLESALQRLPKSGAKVNREAKMMQVYY